MLTKVYSTPPILVSLLALAATCLTFASCDSGQDEPPSPGDDGQVTKAIKAASSSAAIQVILVLYGLFVVALVIMHCCLNRRENRKREKCRDAKERADSLVKAEERRKRMKSLKKSEEVVDTHKNCIHIQQQRNPIQITVIAEGDY